MSFQGDVFFVVSKDDLIRSKRAAGRDIDLEDVRLLESGEPEDTQGLSPTDRQ
jgi:hypothetical protein